MALNNCQAGHETHDSKLVDTAYGPWWIWAWEKYQWQGAYCPGQDEVSKSIEITGWWEKPDTDRMLAILREKPGMVLDFGSHIGWFTVQALELGCEVWALDADPENMRLLWENIDRSDFGGDLATTTSWVADLPPDTFKHDDHIRFLKCDLEGHEWEMVNLTRHLWQARLIDYALLEISPIFETRSSIQAPNYAALVDELIGYGYRATVYKSEGDWEVTGADCTFDQENVLFSRL